MTRSVMAFEEVRADFARQSETALYIRISWGQAMHIDIAVGASVGRSTPHTGLAGRTGDRIFTRRREHCCAGESAPRKGMHPLHDLVADICTLFAGADPH